MNQKHNTFLINFNKNPDSLKQKNRVDYQRNTDIMGDKNTKNDCQAFFELSTLEKEQVFNIYRIQSVCSRNNKVIGIEQHFCTLSKEWKDN